ncbi:zinc-binding alcohol dehydrogenase family protein [Bdellovibrio sp. HCB209]|uniref:zinc-binding alcohol dehydrogenase family protein n=1 Tax=Bdellovibrio sp. HCB209 TaxID=3394354 RepID=UPI0039B5AF0C
MKALGYDKAHSVADFQIKELELPQPELRPLDVLVDVKAFSVNPVDYKIRISRSGKDGQPVVLGWDVAGVISAIGSGVKKFEVGDEVYGAGDLTRPGSYAEQVAIDSRVIALKPKTIDFAEAAALPLTSLTAWEAMISRSEMNLNEASHVLIIGGAGGVGSIAIQLLKSLTKAKVIVTASREDSVKWVKSMGADYVIDYRKDLDRELNEIGIKEVDAVFGTNHTEKYLSQLSKIIRPFGHLALIDDPAIFDVVSFKARSISVHWELMFTKTLFGYKLETQGEILSEVARLVDEGKVKTTMTSRFNGASVDNIKKAHEILESGSSIGKIVVER